MFFTETTFNYIDFLLQAITEKNSATTSFAARIQRSGYIVRDSGFADCSTIRLSTINPGVCFATPIFQFDGLVAMHFKFLQRWNRFVTDAVVVVLDGILELLCWLYDLGSSNFFRMKTGNSKVLMMTMSFSTSSIWPYYRMEYLEIAIVFYGSQCSLILIVHRLRRVRDCGNSRDGGNGRNCGDGWDGNIVGPQGVIEPPDNVGNGDEPTGIVGNGNVGMVKPGIVGKVGNVGAKRRRALRLTELETWEVYPKSWNAIYVGWDNVGMWNIRVKTGSSQYLGQAVPSSKSTALLNHGEMNILFQRMLFSRGRPSSYNRTSIIQ
ncbi:hypothetical protein IFM89_019651 [Coptis chinensis]|uniref:Uncharacterized protein n=1 Tax=Coptis chinensis TaxID=261450 RepID=A0A835I3P6_9MAGN|nr:hypothetical protein IFM89_019651 [Coptis chinensis]